MLVLGEIGGDRVVQVLKETVKSADKKLTLSALAFEVLDSLNATEGVARPVAEGLPEIYENTIDNSKMVLVPAGIFLYGSREDDKVADSNEKPQRVIDLPAFYMDVFPVTNGQFCEFLNSKMPDKVKLEKWIYLEGSYEDEKCRINKVKNLYKVEKGHGRHPVVYVTWYGADEYAKWADKRLPTEQEWEKAARGTEGRIYPWGDAFAKNLCNSYESEINGTTEVGKYPKDKSCYGCYDMAGNVIEWTNSHYDKDKYTFVLRGGSWYFGTFSCRCANRFNNLPGSRDFYVGFRCARTLTL